MKTILIVMAVVLLAGLVGGALGLFGGCAQVLIQERVLFQEKTYRVPMLHGEDIYLKESELDKLKPLHWAMMLDIVNDKASHEAYERQCEKDPKLAPAVEKLFATKIMIDNARTRTERRRTILR